MDKRKKILTVTGVTSVLALGGGGLAHGSGAVGGEGQETTVTGAEADRAGKVAVESVGGGTVVKVFQESEGDIAYEVEVKKTDGSTAEVEITKDSTVAPAEKGETGPEGPEGPEGGQGAEGAEPAK